jgi:beta-1,3-galactosyl-O-glycosyl-glycoprotein beta-1,6-N-acetylglucosaminyltransferase/N-acetyllactosaminide beta-1,6-N-acetylglucosaminyltransferase
MISHRLNHATTTPKAEAIPHRLNHSKPETDAMTSSTCQPHGPRRLVTDVDCQRIIEGDEKYIDWAQKSVENTKFSFKSDEEMGDIAKNCDVFLSKYNYGNYFVTDEEYDFPIAFSILTYKDAMQTEKLLRSIYRSHNVYCIHVDKNAKPSLHRAINNIAKCLHNVFIASKLEDVIYAGFSRLQADLNCISDLVSYTSVPWKYFINIPHQQFPLKTNSEIVKILKIYNGANDVEGITNPARMFRIRYMKSFKLKGNNIVNTGQNKSPPPHNITVVKGSAYGAFSRAFVNFALHDKIAMDVLNWCRDVKSPDEYFWATLNFNKRVQAPGGYTGMFHTINMIKETLLL